MIVQHSHQARERFLEVGGKAAGEFFHAARQAGIAGDVDLAWCDAFAVACERHAQQRAGSGRDAQALVRARGTDLQPAGEATKVTITQSNLTGGVRESDESMRERYEKTWRGVLDGLAKTVAH